MSYTDTQAQSPLIINQMPTATYEETTKSSSEVYVVTDPAGKNMNNLTDTGYSVLNNSKALETGAVCSDNKIYNDIYNYAHSSFDLSKFTVIGSPNITADGKVMGFGTTGNGIGITSVDLSSASTWDIITPYFSLPTGTTYDTDHQYIRYVCRNTANTKDIGLNISLKSSGTFLFSIMTENQDSKTFNDGASSDGKTYRYKVSYDGTSFIISKQEKGKAWTDIQTFTTTENLPAISNPFYIGMFSYATNGNPGSGTYSWFNNLPLDLKGFEIRKNGYPVFISNKTGLDVIKGDNFTEFGSPTITSDGVISRLSTSNYLSLPVTIMGETDIIIKGSWVYGTDLSSNQWLFAIYDSTKVSEAIQIVPYYSNVIQARVKNGDNTFGSLAINDSEVKKIPGKKYNFELIISGTSVTFTVNGVTKTRNDFVAFTSNTCHYGLFTNNNPFAGSSDLNDLVVYINGQLVYQPCLKIPYTQTAEQYGSKIVDVVYRPRVTDAYNQGYLNRYYTIDEANKNFTLPQGEIYGLIETTVERNQLVAQSLNVVQNSQEKGVNKNIFNSLRDDFHSTFDKSKFTIVGSPIITDDGLASGITANNKIRTNLTNSGTKLVATCGFYYKVPTSANGITLGLLETGTGSGNCYVATSGKIGMSIPASTAETLLITTTDMTLTEGDFIVARMEFTEGSTSKFIVENRTTGQVVIKEGTQNWNKNIEDLTSMYFGSSGSNNPYDGIIDLKYYSLSIDGYPVFSGNKTGIDTIKSDDYTINGTLTITDDGVATGFTNSNYVNTGLQVSSLQNKSWSIISPICSGYTASDYGDKMTLLAQVGYGSDGTMLFEGTTKSFKFFINTPSDTNPETRANNRISVVKTLTVIPEKLQARLDFNISTGTYTCYYNIFDGNGWQVAGTLTPTTAQKQLYDIVYNSTNTVKIERRDFDNANTVTADLNSFKVYTDGDLIYQPCLKIPYVSSKDGKKMVYPVYQLRVQDCYEQFGQANYTVIDEDNKEYFLPLGSASGFYGKRVLVDSYRNGINYWEVYSDGTVEQGGSCTSGTAVNLLKPFADTNYVVTVPYSAKTKTSFTPSQTGDWIAKGQGSL